MPKLPRLRELREAAFLSQAELAQRAGVSRVTIVDLEAGRAEARWTTGRKLAEALGVAPTDLIETVEMIEGEFSDGACLLCQQRPSVLRLRRWSHGVGVVPPQGADITDKFLCEAHRNSAGTVAEMLRKEPRR